MGSTVMGGKPSKQNSRQITERLFRPYLTLEYKNPVKFECGVKSKNNLNHILEVKIGAFFPACCIASFNNTTSTWKLQKTLEMLWKRAQGQAIVWRYVSFLSRVLCAGTLDKHWITDTEQGINTVSHAVCLCRHLEAKGCKRLKYYLMKEYPFSGKTRTSII